MTTTPTTDHDYTATAQQRVALAFSHFCDADCVLHTALETHVEEWIAIAHDKFVIAERELVEAEAEASLAAFRTDLPSGDTEAVRA